jgi:hypothetical protein
VSDILSGRGKFAPPTAKKIKSYKAFKAVAEVTVSKCPTCSNTFVDPSPSGQGQPGFGLQDTDFGKLVGNLRVCTECYNDKGARASAEQYSGSEIRALGKKAKDTSGEPEYISSFTKEMAAGVVKEAISIPPEVLAVGAGATAFALSMKYKIVEHNNAINNGEQHADPDCGFCKAHPGKKAAKGDPYWSDTGPQTYCKNKTCKKLIGQNQRRFVYKDGSSYCNDDDCGQAAERDFQAALSDERGY